MTRAAASPFPLHVAAIDIGSNGIRFIAAEYRDATRFKVILQDRAAIRLGHTVFQTGDLDADAMEAALAVLKAFRRQLDDLKIRHVRAVATSAVREAGNQDEFVLRAHREAGVDIEVISGSEEARLVHAAFAQRIPMGTDSWLLVDVGGGSVELSLADGRGIQWSETYPLGAVRLLVEYASCKGDANRFQAFVAETVGTGRIAGAKPIGIAATGGNIEELARLCGLDTRDKTVVMDVKRLRETIERVSKLSSQERAALGLRPDRADVIVPAGLVYEQVARLVGVAAINVPFVGLKEGILHDLVAGLTGRTTLARKP